MSLVNHPPHYTSGRKYEPIDVLERFFPREPLLWQVGKYLARWGRKGNGLPDLQKAEWYIQRRMQFKGSIGLIDPIAYDMIHPILADWYQPQAVVPDAIRGCAYALLTIPCSDDQIEAERAMRVCMRELMMAVDLMESKHDIR